MIIVGGRNSANTKRLTEISASVGTKTYFIEQASELDLEHIKKYDNVGIAAGASTAKETIEEVVEKIRALLRNK